MSRRVHAFLPARILALTLSAHPAHPALLAPILALTLLAHPAWAVGGRVAVHGVHLDPRGDAEGLGKDGWGGELEGVVTFSPLPSILALSGGVMISQFSSEKVVFQPGPFAFRRELTTEQMLYRFYLGSEVGPHGHGFFQPFVAAHGGVVVHSLSQTLTEPDDVIPENTRTQSQSENDTGIGYDAAAGVCWNFNNRFSVVTGARYLRSYGLNEQLGEDEKTVDPEYIEAFVGLGVDVGWIDSMPEPTE